MARLVGSAAGAPCVSGVRWLVIACWLLTALACGRETLAQTAHPSAMEPAVKAAYLFKFGGYVDWPQAAFASPDSPFTIGILDDDIAADALMEIAAGRTIHGRSVRVRKLRRNDPLAGLHVLFIGRANNLWLQEFLTATSGSSILTVTEVEEAHPVRGMINFLTIDHKIRFEVTLRAADRSNLDISARLLTAAYKIARSAS